LCAGRRRYARPPAEPEVRTEARLHRTDDALVGGTERTHHHRRRLQCCSARMRCLEPQGIAQRGQPHTDRGRGARPIAGGARLGRHWPQIRSCARALLHLVELSLARLDEERPRSAARSHVGVAGACRPSQRAPGARAVPELGTAVRPCAADPRGRGLSQTPTAKAIALLRAGRPLRIDGEAPFAIAAVETTGQALLDLLDPKQEAPLLISGQRAAALSLGNLKDAADPIQPVVIEHSAWLDAASALALADPGRDLDRGPI